jgi:drug/metabolite transporter (DMT)-like permease
VNSPSSPPSASGLRGLRLGLGLGLGPGIFAATAFACSDVFGKVVFAAGGDVLTLLAVRSIIGIACVAAWLRMGAKPAPFTPRERWIALGQGILFAITVYGLYKAIDLMDVPTAILAYFIYPLITGFVAAMTGMEWLGWRGTVAAAVAFLGLALMIGAHPGELDLAGVLYAFVAAVSRAAMLLITRARLAHVDARLTTWYSTLSSTVLFVGTALLMRHWQPPAGGVGWAAMVGTGLTTTAAIFAVFISASRIGPFRTALVMNLEPLLAAIGSTILFGDIIAPLQALGGALMLAALVAFQLRR